MPVPLGEANATAVMGDGGLRAKAFEFAAAALAAEVGSWHRSQ